MPKRMNDRARPERWEDRAADFARDVWSVYVGGFVFIAAKDRAAGTWREHALRLPVSRRALVRLLKAHPREHYDLYFCPNAFDSATRKKHLAQPTPYAWVDIDDADPDAFDPPPGVLIETSRRRYQGLWRFRDTRDVAEAEVYSRALAYRFGADRNGWSVTKYLRLPHTINHKPGRKSAEVRLLCGDLRNQIRPLVPVDPSDVNAPGTVKMRAAVILPADDWREVAAKYRKKLHPRVRSLIWTERTYTFERDRSKCIFEIIAGLYEAGAPPEEIALIVFANPYFRSKHGLNAQRALEEVTRVLAKRGGRHD